MTIEEDFASVVVWTHREVDPIGRTAFFLDQLVEIPFSPIRDVEQYPRHPDHLLWAIAAYIHRAPRQMITPFRTPTLPIHLLTPIPTRDNDRNVSNYFPSSVRRGRGGLNMRTNAGVQTPPILP